MLRIVGLLELNFRKGKIQSSSVCDPASTESATVQPVFRLCGGAYESRNISASTRKFILLVELQSTRMIAFQTTGRREVVPVK